MVRRSLSRRRFGASLAAVTTIGLAGCADEDDGAANDDDFETDDPGDLTIYLENEDGEPVSSGVEVTVAIEEENFSSHYRDEIVDGELETGTLLHEGEYTVTVESVDDEFDAVEESVTLGEDDETVTVVVEGAVGDDEAAAEGEDDEDE